MNESPVTEAGSVPTDLSTALTSKQAVSDLLTTIVDLAVAGVDGVGGASISVSRTDPAGYLTVTATDDSIRAADEMQYSGGGPCVEAIVRSSEVMLTLPCPDWPDFSEAATGTGTSAVWSLPLSGADVAASLNLYASVPAPWDDDAAGVARMLAGQAARLLAHASDLARCEQVNSTLRRALETRTIIGQAQGVLMARQGITAEDAFDILRRASQRTNRKLRDIATDIVAGLLGEAHLH